MNNRIAVKRNSGFTLIELLVVMAISIILMGLVMAPVYETFQMTRRAQAMVDAQDSARIAMQQISREIGEAMDVLDYTADTIQVPVYDPNNPNTVYWRDLPYAKIDLVLPKMIVHCNNPAHDPDQPREFERGDEAMPICPVCGSPDVEVKPKLPIEQGNTVVRYFLGLKYNNPHPGPAATPPHTGWQSPWGDDVLAGEGNQVVLYRLEFDPNDASIFGDKDAAQKLMQVLKDPKFFYSDANAADGRPFWQHWAEKARVIGIDKYQDLVTGIDKNNDGVFESLQPSVGFRFAKVENDTFTGVDYGNTPSEDPNAPPSAYRAKFGYWTPNAYAGVTAPLGISAYRYADSSGSVDTANTTMYYTALSGGNLVIMKRVGSSNPSQIFDITRYMQAGMIDLDTIDRNTDMGFYFDFARTTDGELVDFIRGMVNFALSVRPMELDSADIGNINADFASQFATNRSPLPRKLRLEAMDILRNATVVPGSDVVMGPDMTPGAATGSVVRYARVSLDLGSAGFNEYQINYSTGDIFFSPVVKQDLPTGPDAHMRIDYKVQFNKESDAVIGDYQTKALIDIRIGIRMFDPESKRPHVVDLNSRVQVRNALR